MLVELLLSGSMIISTGAPTARLDWPVISGIGLLARLSISMVMVGAEAAAVVLKSCEAEAAVLTLPVFTPEATPDATEALIVPLLFTVGVTTRV